MLFFRNNDTIVLRAISVRCVMTLMRKHPDSAAVEAPKDPDTNNVYNLLKLFIPTAPNPTTGFVVMVAPDKVQDLSWTVQEAMNVVISGGIIGPGEL